MMVGFALRWEIPTWIAIKVPAWWFSPIWHRWQYHVDVGVCIIGIRFEFEVWTK